MNSTGGRRAHGAGKRSLLTGLEQRTDLLPHSDLVIPVKIIALRYSAFLRR